jgi:hypothetical protein
MSPELDVWMKATPFRALRGFMDAHLDATARERVLRTAAAEFPSSIALLGDRPPLVSERVPVVLLNRLVELTAGEMKQPSISIAHRVGRESAREASSGVLRLAMVLISIPNLLRKVAPTWAQMYSHGKMTQVAEGRTATLELTDFPIESPVNCARVTGTLEWFAQQAEKNAVVRHVLCRSNDGGDVCRWDVRW